MELQNNKSIDQQYRLLLKRILNYGYEYTDPKRNVKCLQLDDYKIDYNVHNGYNKFPLITLRRLPFKLILSELIWFLRGDSTLTFLHEHNNHIWDKDARNFNPSEDIVGRAYGPQWRKWRGYMDQICTLIYNLENEPLSRRHIVTAWDPLEVIRKDMALPPCHWSFEIIVRPLTPLECARYGREFEPISNKYKGSKAPQYGFTLKWHQRSVDTYLGLPFNIASYAILGNLIQYMTGHVFMRLIGDLSNVHLYENAIEAAKTVSNRRIPKIRPELHISPLLKADLMRDVAISVKLNHAIKRSMQGIDIIKYYPHDNIPVKMLEPIN